MQIKNLIRRGLIGTAAALMLSPVSFAEKNWNAPSIVTRNCSGCHGIDGNAQLPSFPRVAGLNADYAAQKLAEFKTAAAPPVDELFSRLITSGAKPETSSPEARVNMIGVAHAITADEATSSAAWYASQKPAKGRVGNAAFIERGQALFAKGSPTAGLLACQTCHGMQAQGKAKIPRLAGQNSAYIYNELVKFMVGDRRHAPEMTMVAKHFDTDECRALAAYLQSL